MTHILDGKKISNDILEEIRQQTKQLQEQQSIKPGLALLLVGDNPASHVYVRAKIKACESAGFHSVVTMLPETATESEILNTISFWNAASDIHGILVQLPLPKHIDEGKILMEVNPNKDVDGFHPVNVGKLVAGLPGFVPCTPAGIVELLHRSNISTYGKHVVVLGRSNIVGKPVANLLMQKNNRANAIVTVCHTAAKDISYYTRQADILIAAVGKANYIGASDVKEGVVVVDVGINRVSDVNSKKGYVIAGDVNFAEVMPIAHAITPVPGGVGPMTIAMLLSNTVQSALQTLEH